MVTTITKKPVLVARAIFRRERNFPRVKRRRKVRVVRVGKNIRILVDINKGKKRLMLLKEDLILVQLMRH